MVQAQLTMLSKYNDAVSDVSNQDVGMYRASHARRWKFVDSRLLKNI